MSLPFLLTELLPFVYLQSSHKKELFGHVVQPKHIQGSFVVDDGRIWTWYLSIHLSNLPFFIIVLSGAYVKNCLTTELKLGSWSDINE